MKDKLRMLGAMAFGLAAMAMPPMSPAQNTSTQNQTAQQRHYILIDIPTLGGPTSSYAFAGDASKIINSQGTAVAQADTSTPGPFCLVDCFVNHTFSPSALAQRIQP